MSEKMCINSKQACVIVERNIVEKGGQRLKKGYLSTYVDIFCGFVHRKRMG